MIGDCMMIYPYLIILWQYFYTETTLAIKFSGGEGGGS